MDKAGKLSIKIKPLVLSEVSSECIIVGVYLDAQQLSQAVQALPSACQSVIQQNVQQKRITAKPGSTLLLSGLIDIAAQHVLLVGLGKTPTKRDYRKAVKAAYEACVHYSFSDVVDTLPLEYVESGDKSWKLQQAAYAATAASYSFDRFKSEKEKSSLKNVVYYCGDDLKSADDKKAVQQGEAIAAGAALARTLGNLPGNVCTPTYLAEQAESLAKTWKLKCDILDKKDLEKLGMGSFLSVAAGSKQPPKLICLHYQGADKDTQPIALVGKGVTFDSGGISLKPGADMDEMKFDMCGAASVLGTLQAAAQLNLPLNIVGIIPATENMPGGNATRPGDIVKSMSGQTIEILNTDAEGRLILCDALTYAAKFNPEVVIDIATLTGACVVALGEVAAGLFSNNNDLAQELMASGYSSMDLVWQLPLWEDYQPLLDSNFADMANVGSRWGGAISAACFLSRFTKDYCWAHLDIAGVAWKSGKEKGATGRPVPLLVHYLLRRIALTQPGKY